MSIKYLITFSKFTQNSWTNKPGEMTNNHKIKRQDKDYAIYRTKDQLASEMYTTTNQVSSRFRMIIEIIHNSFVPIITDPP